MNKSDESIHGRLGLGLDNVVVGYSTGSNNNKTINEDYFWPRNSDDAKSYDDIDCIIAGRLYIVADGVSKGLRGDQASKLAARTIAQQYYEEILQLERYPDTEDIKWALQKAILSANKVLLAESRRQREALEQPDSKKYLQTTAVCAVWRGKTLIIAYVGDSRLYRLRIREQNADLFEVTLLPQGYTEDNKFFIGTEKLKPDGISIYKEDNLLPNDILLLCSDGLYKFIHPLNDPRGAEDSIAEARPNYNKDKERGLINVCRDLLTRADDPRTNGGGDNITVMLIEQPSSFSYRHLDRVVHPPPDKISPDQKEQIDQVLTHLIKYVWPDSGEQIDQRKILSESALTLLGTWCAAKVKQEVLAGSEDSALWQRRAIQLGIKSTSQPVQVEKAQELVEQLGVGFDDNKSIVEEILDLLTEVPDNWQLRKIAYTALTDLSSIPLLDTGSDRSEANIRQMMLEAADLFSRYNRIITNNQSTPSSVVSGTTSHQSLDLSLISKKSNSDNTLDPGETKIQAKPKSQSNVEQNPAGLLAIFPRPSSSVVYGGLFAAFLLVSVVIILILGDQDLNSSTTSTAPTTSAIVPTSMTALSSPTPVILTPTTVQTRSVSVQANPNLKINQIDPQIEFNEVGRNTVTLITHLSIAESEIFKDPEAILELHTTVPTGLSPTGGGSPEPEISPKPDIPIIQRIPLKNVTPQDTSFNTRYRVEPPDVGYPVYTFTVEARVIGSDGQQSIVDTQSQRVSEINYVSDLSVTQTVTPTLVKQGDMITYTITVRNTGETRLYQFAVNQDESELAGLNASGLLHGVQKELEQIQLSPGEEQTIITTTTVLTNYPGLLEPVVGMEALLADDTVISATTLPVSMSVYVEAKTAPPPEGYGEHKLREFSGEGTAENPSIGSPPEDWPVKILDAERTLYQEEYIVWYKLEVTLPDTQQPVVGWLWSDRVSVGQEIKDYLQQEATLKFEEQSNGRN